MDLFVWVVLGLPILALAITIVFQTPVGSSYLYITSALIFLYIARTIVDVPHAALGAEMQSLHNGTMSFFGWRSAFSVLGILLSAYVIYHNKGEVGASLHMLSVIAITLCLILTFVMQVYFGKLKHKPPRQTSIKKITLFGYPKRVRTLFVVFGLNQIGNAFAASLVLLYINNILHLKAYSGLFLGVLFLCGALSIPFWIKLGSRFSKQTVWSYSILIACLAFSVVPFLHEGDFIIYMLVCIISGTCFGCDAVIPPVLLANFLSDEKRESQFGGAYASKALIGKASLVLPILIAFPILDSVGFITENAENTDLANYSLIYLYAAVPLVFKIPAAVIYYDFFVV